MNFFEHQDKARGKTKVLVVYFMIAVVCITASVYLASVLIFYGASINEQQPGDPSREFVLWDPELFLYVVLGTLGVVIVGSLYKTAALAKGGSAVMEESNAAAIRTESGTDLVKGSSGTMGHALMWRFAGRFEHLAGFRSVCARAAAALKPVA